MGCCSALQKNIELKKDVFITIEKEDELMKKNDYDKVKEEFTTSQAKQFIKKESPPTLKEEIVNNNTNNSQQQKRISSKTQNIHKDDKFLKVNKNRIIKKGSERIQRALKELKLLSIKEVDNNKKYFS